MPVPPKYEHLRPDVEEMCRAGNTMKEIADRLMIPEGTVPFLLRKWGLKTHGLRNGQRDAKWFPLFEACAPKKPILTVNQLRILIHHRFGVWVTECWLKKTMRSQGTLMPRKEALEKARCECSRLVSLYQKCSLCGKRKEVIM